MENRYFRIVIIVLTVIGIVIFTVFSLKGGHEKNDSVPPVTYEVYDYPKKSSTKETFESIQKKIFNEKTDTTDNTVSVISNGISDGNLIDKKYQILEYCDDANGIMYFVDISDKTVNEIVPYIINDKILRFDEDIAFYVGDDKFLGRCYGETTDFDIGYRKMKDGEYVIFDIWNKDCTKSWLFLDCTIEERIQYWNNELGENNYHEVTDTTGQFDN